jgi:hypothetical protein
VAAATDVVALSRLTSAVRETVPGRRGGTWIFDSRKSNVGAGGASFNLVAAFASSSGGVTGDAPQLPPPRTVKACKQDTDAANTLQSRTDAHARVTQSG